MSIVGTPWPDLPRLAAWADWARRIWLWAGWGCQAGLGSLGPAWQLNSTFYTFTVVYLYLRFICNVYSLVPGCKSQCVVDVSMIVSRKYSSSVTTSQLTPRRGAGSCTGLPAWGWQLYRPASLGYLQKYKNLYSVCTGYTQNLIGQCTYLSMYEQVHLRNQFL